MRRITTHCPAQRAPQRSGEHAGHEVGRYPAIQRAGPVPGPCRKLSVLAVAGGTSLADRPAGPAYPVTLFDEPSARAASRAERWVDQRDAGSAAVLPMLSFQLTECSAD
jgi:hypothetical protein